MIQPHGGKLINRIANENTKEQLTTEAREMQSLKITKDALTDLQNIAHGVFSPLEGFFFHEDMDGVVKGDALANGLPWSIPITLSAEEVTFKEGETIVLEEETNGRIATMDVEDLFTYDKNDIANTVFGTTDLDHPGVNKLFSEGKKFIGGKINLIKDIEFPYMDHYLSPEKTRAKFADLGWKTVVAFQTRNPPHRAHEYIQKCALEIVDGLFINPVIGKKKVGDFTDDLILDAYGAALSGFYPDDRAFMSILPWEMRYAGPKEAIFHCIVRKNFGCTHHIIGRDHAGVGNYYDTYAAHRIFDDYAELGIQPLFFEHSFYCTKCGNMGTSKTCSHGKADWLSPSGTKIRGIVTEGADIDPYIMRPEVAGILKNATQPFVE
jgi:sulfate adenylyltransferase